jgi:hypothetical protein
VADLAADSAWQVTMLGGNKWTTAELSLHHEGHRWVVGLTPIPPDVVALIVWCDDGVIAHARDTEAAMCAAAYDWASRTKAGSELDVAES